MKTLKKLKVFKTDRELTQFHLGREFERKETKQKLAELKKRIKKESRDIDYFNNYVEENTLLKMIDEVFGK